MEIIFLDTETTGLADGRLVQLAYKNAASGEIVNEYFKPPVPIGFGAMAVHHITNEMVENKPLFSGSTHYENLQKILPNSIVVAHNAPFDLGILKNEGITVPKYIDTLRVSRHLITSEQHKLQYLRYALNLNVIASAHDALGDILVLEALFMHLKPLVVAKFGVASDEEIIEKMIALNSTPVMLDTFAFGKYKGQTFEEVSVSNSGYLEWLYNSESQKNHADQNEELIVTLKHYLHII